jgi:type II secretory pathway pseudopilin PulG
MIDRKNRLLIELRWPLVALALSMIFGGVIATASWYIEQRKALEHQQANNRLRSVQLALNNVRRDESDVKTYQAAFETLASQGVFTNEQRLTWIEYMNSLKASGHVQSLRYKLGPQKLLNNLPLANANAIDVMSSKIQLDMGFFHEGDLIWTLENIQNSNDGFYRFNTCTFVRKDLTDLSKAENILANCELQWITVRSKSTGNSQ